MAEKRNADELLIDALVLKAIETTGDMDTSHEEEEAKAALNELDLQLIHRETKKAVQRYVAQQRRKKALKKSAQIAACALIMIAVASLPVLNIKAVRDRIIQFAVIQFDEFSLISSNVFYSGEHANNHLEPTWLPAAYKHRQVIINDPTFEVIYYYDDSGENFISFQISYEPTQTVINTEDAEITQLDDESWTILISAREDERILAATDLQTGYQIVISGKWLSQEEILKILESVTEVE